MEIKDIKELITDDVVKEILVELGADYLESNNIIRFRTICHCGDSHKLFYYKNTKLFNCYTNCGSMDIINVIENAYKISTAQALAHLKFKLNIEDNIGFETEKSLVSKDLEYIKSFTNKKTPLETDIAILDNKLLNNFYNLYHRSFVDDGISCSSMRKYGLKFDILNYRIIIPVHDLDGNLISIRCRNLDEEIVAKGLKYVPIVIDKETLAAPTGSYLFGANFNKDNIRAIKKVIIVESEKSVMQLDLILEENIGVSISGSNLSNKHIEILRELGVETVILALDKEFENYGDDEEILYAKKVRKYFIDRLKAYFNVEVVWDKNNLLNKKDSPTDRGRDIFLRLYDERMSV